MLARSAFWGRHSLVGYFTRYVIWGMPQGGASILPQGPTLHGGTCYALLGKESLCKGSCCYPDRHLFTDASGSWGCGAHAMPSWLQAAWPQPHCLPSIALKELIPVLLAAAIWGCSWSGSLVQLHTDNAAVVTQVNNLYSRDLRACNLLRVLAFFQALFDFRLRAVHIPGVLNAGADDLSRNRALAFLHRHPSASPCPSQVDPDLLLLLCQEEADWNSRHWRERFNGFLTRVLQSQPRRYTGQDGTAFSHSHLPFLCLSHPSPQSP